MQNTTSTDKVMSETGSLYTYHYYDFNKILFLYGNNKILYIFGSIACARWVLETYIIIIIFGKGLIITVEYNNNNLLLKVHWTPRKKENIWCFRLYLFRICNKKINSQYSYNTTHPVYSLFNCIIYLSKPLTTLKCNYKLFIMLIRSFIIECTF